MCHSYYYGKTYRNAKIRCNEYLGISKSGSKLASPIPSSIWDHMKQAGHSASLDDFSIISKTDNSFELLIHERLSIQRDSPCLNSQQSIHSHGPV